MSSEKPGTRKREPLSGKSQAARSDKVCPQRAKMVDELLACAELEAERRPGDTDTFYGKRKKPNPRTKKF